MEQRFHAVMECLGGTPKTEVAARYGVSRQSVHTWLARYAAGGIKALEDQSHRVHRCPHRIDASVEALVCELRRDHPRCSLQVAGQRIQVGVVHARKLVTVALDEHTVTVYDNDTPIKAVPRRSTTDLNRTKAHHEITA